MSEPHVNVDVNDQIKKGQVLVELDNAKLSDQVLRSQAVLDAAIAKVVQTVATLNESKANLARLEEMFRLSGGRFRPKANSILAAPPLNGQLPIMPAPMPV